MLDPHELRFSLLFWDKLEFPASQAIHISGGPDARFLESEGIIQRTKVPFPGGSIDGSVYRAAHVGVFMELDLKEPGVWSLATGERSISFLDEELESGKGAIVTLHRSIPVPDKDVALQDILEFKKKRYDELLDLRHHLERIYQHILSAGDGNLSIRTEVESLEKSISDYLKVVRESGLRFRFADFSANINLLSFVAPAISYVCGMPALEALGIAAAAFSLEAGVALKRAKATGTPFRYISSFHKDLF